MLTKRTVVASGTHATVLKTCALIRTDRDHCAQAFHWVLSCLARFGLLSSRSFRTGSPFVVCWWSRKNGPSWYLCSIHSPGLGLMFQSGSGFGQEAGIRTRTVRFTGGDAAVTPQSWREFTIYDLRFTSASRNRYSSHCGNRRVNRKS